MGFLNLYFVNKHLPSWPLLGPQLIGTKLGQNMCDHKISDEIGYECNRTRTV